MKGKIFLIVIILFLMPFQLAIGLKLDITIADDNQVTTHSPNLDVISMINDIEYSMLFGYLEKIVSFGIRYVGSENCRKASEYINEELNNLGLYSYVDSWRFPRYKCQNVLGPLPILCPTPAPTTGSPALPDLL